MNCGKSQEREREREALEPCDDCEKLQVFEKVLRESREKERKMERWMTI